MSIGVGNTAPWIQSFCEDGTEIELSDLRGQNIVLYFYPKDDTPGCTIEAQDFTKYLPEFEKLKTIILGVSKDSKASHCKFIDKYNIGFNLIADEEKKLCETYDVLKEKSMFGKKYIGIQRSTFLIDANGNIAKIWRNVKVKGHAEEVINLIKTI
ncbi:peroxiredoxin [Rickettsiales bacterium]|nr:peroxiredoxin [Rickettsiales bacterium]